MEEPVFKPVSASMKKTAYTTLDDVLRPIQNALAYNNIEERIRRINNHLKEVKESDSYPVPITSAMIGQAVAFARSKFTGSLAARILDPRAL